MTPGWSTATQVRRFRSRSSVVAPIPAPASSSTASPSPSRPDGAARAAAAPEEQDPEHADDDHGGGGRETADLLLVRVGVVLEPGQLGAGTGVGRVEPERALERLDVGD